MANATVSTPSLIDRSTNFTSDKSSMTIALLVLSLLAVFTKVVWQPAWPDKSPKLVRAWPIFGAIQLFGKKRLEFLQNAAKQSITGNFSTYIGKHQVVALSGHEARKFYFETKPLSLAEGSSALFVGNPATSMQVKVGDHSEDFAAWFSATLLRLLRRENFVRNLAALVSDTSTNLDRIVKRDGGGGSGIFDPYDDIYRIVYQLTMRTLGPTEIADDSELLDKTLRLFGELDRGASPMRVLFPWLPTPGWLRKNVAGARLFAMFDKIVKQRKAPGGEKEDAFQYLLGTGADMTGVFGFVLASLFAGLLNSGVNAASLLVFLASNPEWYHRIQSEVDASVEKHRTDPSQTPSEVLATIGVEHWETEFPSIDMGLRESIRHNMVGSSYRLNASGRDLPIGSSGEILPRDTFAIYQFDDVHMNPNVYTNPAEFDPGRFLPDRAEDRKVPMGFLGWGLGRHPCLGMRFAKLEMGVITALFVAMFDWELVDAQGVRLTEPPAWIDREKLMTHRPDSPIRMRYTVRQH